MEVRKKGKHPANFEQNVRCVDEIIQINVNPCGTVLIYIMFEALFIKENKNEKKEMLWAVSGLDCLIS